METKLTVQIFKHSGKFYETWTTDVDIDVYDTDTILEYLYLKMERLRHSNFTFKAENSNRMNFRLILNQKD